MKYVLLFLTMVCFPVLAQDDDLKKDEAMTLAVLPFDNVSRQAEFDWLSAGFAEQLTAGLAKVRTIRVVERLQLDKIIKEQDLQMSDLVDETKAVKVGQVLTVKKLLLGSFQILNEQLLVSARIVDAETGAVDTHHVFRAEDQLDNIFEIYDELTRTVVKSFGIKLSKKQTTLMDKTKKSGTKKIQAYEFYIKGLQAYNRGDEKSLKEARDLFKKALNKDKKYMDARKALGNTYIKLNELDDAIDEYEKISKSPDVTEEIYYTLGLFYTIKGKTDKAVSAYQSAIRMHAGYADAYYNLGVLYRTAGQFAAAYDMFGKALMIEDDNPDYQYEAAVTLMGLNKQYDALNLLQQALENGFQKKEKIIKDKEWDAVRFQSRFKELMDEYFE